MCLMNFYFCFYFYFFTFSLFTFSGLFYSAVDVIHVGCTMLDLHVKIKYICSVYLLPCIIIIIIVRPSQAQGSGSQPNLLK
jgi:hypothetical protein